MRLPTFFVVGAAKSGTTTLFEALRAHSDVYVPSLKEPHVYAYLADPSTSGHLFTDAAAARRGYRELYAAATTEAAVGDCSTTNLVVPGTAELIGEDVPDARIVVILRQPVDRAFSHYAHFVNAGGEPLRTFAEAVAAETTRRYDGHPFTYQYLGWSRYAEPLRRFIDVFGRERVQVHLYDDLCGDAEHVVRSTFRFLGVDDTLSIPVGHHNVVRSPRASRRPWRRSPPAPTLPPEVRAALTAGFADEIDALEDVLDRDLSVWRT